MTKTYAKFEGGKVTQKEMDSYLEFLKNQDPASIPEESDPQYTVLRQNMMDSVIVIKLIERYAGGNGIVVTDEEVSNEIDTVIKQNYASEAAFEKDLPG